MIDILVEHHYPERSSAEVFSALSDHVNFFAKAKIACRLLKQGESEANGRGALREVKAGSARLLEDITAFQAPDFYEYRIRKLYLLGLPIPFNHELGRIEVHDTNYGCRVVWQSRSECTLPVLGKIINQQIRKDVQRTFAVLLRKLFD